MLQIKRIYEQPEPSDGVRILVDRLWPRGVSKDKAQLNEWMKDVAPSPALRKQFHHDPALFETFKKAYEQELTCDPDKQPCLEKIAALSQKQTVTLVYGAKDPAHNNAVVLCDFIKTHFDV
ncbi:DUF488 domain-containing protein [Sporolactobacillus sp. THM7-4]|nr:DUF488 domain-containing protein [Sporolactobacillus sp. THM7-4]